MAAVDQLSPLEPKRTLRTRLRPYLLNFLLSFPLLAQNASLPGRTGPIKVPAYYTATGQFSINGRRPDANYFSIDGVSATVGITQGPKN
ncbi:MAG: hypothetical protein JO336_04890 [Acidobacteriia bacterium]|nr:hypothetical protein [Terriglobia bacterium]MBV8904512.1 hypothetical protein [Terriglobia bacterium]